MFIVYAILPFLVPLVIISLVYITVNLRYYRLYRKTFETISTGKYLINEAFKPMAVFMDPKDSSIASDSDKIIIFEDGSIKLLGHMNYIHLNSLMFLDPYTYYWHKRINKWYDENESVLGRKEVIWHTIKN